VARGRAAGGTSPGTTRGPGKGAAEDRGRRGWGRARPGRVTHGQGEGTRGREEEGEERGRGGGSSPRGSTIATTVHRITHRAKEVEERGDEVAELETKMR
jgi:hypothetical protein